MTRTRTILGAAGLLTAALALAGCGGGAEAQSAPATSASASPSAKAEAGTEAVTWTSSGPVVPRLPMDDWVQQADEQFGAGASQAAFDEMVEYATTQFVDPETLVDEETPGDHSLDDVAGNLARMTPAYAQTFQTSVDSVLSYYRGIYDTLPQEEIDARQQAGRVVLGNRLFDITSKDPAQKLHADPAGGMFITRDIISDPQVYVGSENGKMVVGLAQHLTLALIEGSTPNPFTLDREVYYTLEPAPAGSGHQWLIADVTVTAWDASFANGAGTGFVDS